MSALFIRSDGTRVHGPDPVRPDFGFPISDCGGWYRGMQWVRIEGRTGLVFRVRHTDAPVRVKQTVIKRG